MPQAVQKVKDVASFIPAKARAAIYTILGTLILLEMVWDLLPEPFEGKILKTLSILGFGLAVANTPEPSEGPQLVIPVEEVPEEVVVVPGEAEVPNPPEGE